MSRLSYRYPDHYHLFLPVTQYLKNIPFENLSPLQNQTLPSRPLDHPTGKTVSCSTLDFISLLVPHIPPKGIQMVRYAGLYARNIKHKIAPILLVALEVLRLQFPLSDIQSLLVTAEGLSWDERIKASFGYDPRDLRTNWIGPEGLKCWRCSEN